MAIFAFRKPRVKENVPIYLVFRSRESRKVTFQQNRAFETAESPIPPKMCERIFIRYFYSNLVGIMPRSAHLQLHPEAVTSLNAESELLIAEVHQIPPRNASADGFHPQIFESSAISEADVI